MASYYFFTETDQLSPQQSGDEFGPSGASGGNDRFLITSKHSSTGTSNAYAICNGHVCVQQDTSNSSLVNIILKPIDRFGIDLPLISYIIYKGILKNSIFDGSGGIITNTDNDLVTSVNNSWSAYLASISASSSAPPEESLGIDLTASVSGFDDDDPIDNVFYRSSVDFQLPLVEGGWMLGEFSSTQFGMEIITEKIGYVPKLALARNQENYIEVAQLGGSPTDADFFRHWHEKEAILNFIDPSAFYGSFYANHIFAKTSTGQFISLTGDEIFEEILKGTANLSSSDSNFVNCSKAYIDVRNEHNQSYNYYKNYDVNLSLTFDTSNPFQDVDYYQSGWPLLAVESSDFPTGNSTEKNVLGIGFPQDDNIYPLLYTSQGYRHFSLKTFRRLKGKKRFVELDYVPSNFYTSTEEFVIPNYTSGSDTTVISTILRIKYLRRLPQPGENQPSTGLTIKGKSILDNIFVPFQMQTLISSSSSLLIKVYDEEVFINQSKETPEFIGNVGVAVDNYNYNFFVIEKETNKRLSNIFHKPISISSGASSETTFLEYLNKKIFQESITLGETVLGSGNVSQAVSKAKGFIDFVGKGLTKPNSGEIVLLTLDSSTLSTIQGLIASNSLSTDYKIFFGVNSVDQEVDDLEQPYTSFEILLKGFVESSGAIANTEVQTTVTIYSHDDI